MTDHAEPTIEYHRNRGASVVLRSGPLPEFPEWFVQQLQAMMDRLRAEAEQGRRVGANEQPVRVA